MTEKVLNIFGEEMEPCCFDPLTGWKRDGYCNTAVSYTHLTLPTNREV